MSLIFRFLDTNGNGTGTKQATGNYSVTADDFYYQASGYVNIHRIIIHIEDAFGAQLDEYGNLGAALSNGYEIQLKDTNDVVLNDLTDGVAIQTNADIGRYCYDVTVTSNAGGVDMVQARWTFDKAGGPLEMKDGDKLVITLNDDFTGLTDHTFMVQGIQS